MTERQNRVYRSSCHVFLLFCFMGTGCRSSKPQEVGLTPMDMAAGLLMLIFSALASGQAELPTPLLLAGNA
jgi:hypothetical protein